ncbi:hypothetical protein AKJ09_00604 [Labilithrix luteola]|uniref:Uncharacterized protein n=1 Tax=Labilithrix luteola TaxID=1391654 RepID=A0A0K1PK86_9BACT|nr:DUF5682 family protein [Labilithrix luteola]AKU93940.1 hypothetical protein AKJ09_00604 [Labilithrix luteola]
MPVDRIEEVLTEGEGALCGLDVEKIRQNADAVLREELYWFPVRHHSPAVARHLRTAIRERTPEIIFIEGPSDASELVTHIVDPKTKPPVAIYSSYRDDDNVLGLAGIASPGPDIPAKFASWYPLLPYSPEYVAMKEAAKLGAEVVFVDLPSHALVRSRAERGIPEEGASEVPREAIEAASEDAEPSPEEASSTMPSWETLAVESSLYKGLAAAAGYRSWDECWDALFEAPERFTDVESFRAELAYFCAAVRATTPRAQMENDGTFLRESHMLRMITKTLGERKIPASKAMMVCGGFHLFMARELGPERAIPKGTVYTTVTPYSYARTSDLTGYGAGNRAPAWYARLFERSLESPADAAPLAMVDHIVAVLAKARGDGELLSSADAISSSQHARMLASLRGRKSPSLDDVRDGLIACCCKGSMAQEGRYLAKAMVTVETGSALGRVTPALGRLPLVHDFYKQVDELELGDSIAKDARTKLTLDLRKPLDERRSVFFHRLAQIEIPYVELVSAGQESTLFREVWRIAWSPKVDGELAEKNLHGDTVEAAALARLDDELGATGQAVDEITGRLLKASKMDLPGMVQRLQQVAGEAVDSDARLAPLARALTDLVLLEAHTKRRGLSTDVVAELVDRCFGRACFAMPDAANAPPEEHGDVVSAIRSLSEVLLGERGESFDRELFVENAKSAFLYSEAPFLRGALSGVLTELRIQTTAELAAQVAAFAKARPEVLVTCGEFLTGVLQTSRTAVMLGADAIVAAIDELLKAAAWEQFLTLLPQTRGAFEGMHDRVRVSLADRVAVRYGLRAEEGDTIARLETTVEAAQQLVMLDTRVAEMMKSWEF